jgi:hypothetical protein
VLAHIGTAGTEEGLELIKSQGALALSHSHSTTKAYLDDIKAQVSAAY